MKSFLNYRYLTIKTYESLYDPETFNSVYFFELPVNNEVELDETTLTIQKIVAEKKLDGFNIKEERDFFQCGADGCSQNILLDIAIGVGANIATSVLSKIGFWAKSKIDSEQQISKDDLKRHMPNIQKLIGKHFSPIQRLSLCQTEKTDAIIKAVLKDDNNKNYNVALYSNGKIIQITKQEITNKTYILN